MFVNKKKLSFWLSQKLSIRQFCGEPEKEILILDSIDYQDFEVLPKYCLISGVADPSCWTSPPPTRALLSGQVKQVAEMWKFKMLLESKKRRCENENVWCFESQGGINCGVGLPRKFVLFRLTARKRHFRGKKYSILTFRDNKYGIWTFSYKAAWIYAIYASLQ